MKKLINRIRQGSVLKLGCVVLLAVCLVAGLGCIYLSQKSTVQTGYEVGDRKLPIYCVDTSEKNDASDMSLRVVLLAVCLIAGLGCIYLRQKATVRTGYRVGDRKLPIYCVDTSEKKIALSFDAAWGNEDTQDILSILRENDVKVTFFMTGGWVESYPEDVKAILADGHDLGNHSENHKDMATIGVTEQKEEIQMVHDRVKELTGYEMHLFRAPFGSYNNDLVNTANSLGYATIQWSVDSLDWKNYGCEHIIKTVCNHSHLENGAIILCHNGGKYTADALDTMIKTLKEKGYTFVRISDLIYDEPYHLGVDGKQYDDSGTASDASD